MNKNLALLFGAFLVCFFVIEAGYRILDPFPYFSEDEINNTEHGNLSMYDPLLGWKGVPGGQAEFVTENNRVWLRPEVMGKGTAFGTLDEVLRLSAELEGVAPCIDFSHYHARTGEFNSYPEFAAALQAVQERLGQDALDNSHLHVSGIAYGSNRGEIKHLNLKEADLRYTELLRALKDYAAGGCLICESPNLEEDALLLQEAYAGLH